MKILVTGAAGFVGTNLIKYIKNTHPDWEIRGIDNYFTGSKDNHVDGVEYYDMNTWDIWTWCDLYKADIVFHFGEYSRIVKSFDDREYVMKSNLHGTTQILDYCLRVGAKFIYSASSSKFGNNGADENLSPYSWAKAKIVELIKNYHTWFGLKYEICYFFNVYGPGQIMTGDYATVVGIFERQWLAGEELTVVSPGTQSRDFTHVLDIVRGVEKTVHMNMNREWMLRSGKNIEIVDVARLFTNNWKLVPERRGERFTSEEFKSDTNEVLGWEADRTLEEWVENRKNSKKNLSI
jgi:UDP-glucose 4-epimerase